MSEGGESQPSKEAMAVGHIDCLARRLCLLLLHLIRLLVEDGAPCSRGVRLKALLGPRVLLPVLLGLAPILVELGCLDLASRYRKLRRRVR